MELEGAGTGAPPRLLRREEAPTPWLPGTPGTPGTPGAPPPKEAAALARKSEPPGPAEGGPRRVDGRAEPAPLLASLPPPPPEDEEGCSWELAGLSLVGRL